MRKPERGGKERRREGRELKEVGRLPRRQREREREREKEWRR